MRVVFESKPDLSEKEAHALLDKVMRKCPAAVGASYSHITGETVVELGDEVEELIRQKAASARNAFGTEKGFRVGVDNAS